MMKFSLDNKVYLIGLPISIKKGQYYLAVNCKTCELPLLILRDSSNGHKGFKLPTDGWYKVPCPKCLTFQVYEASLLYSVKAKFSRLSYKDRRPAPSVKRPYPLLPRHKKDMVVWGVGALEQSPVAAAVIARIVTYWTNVELSLAGLLGVLMKTDSEAATAVYLSFRQSRAKVSALESAAKVTLDDADFELFEALIRWKDSVEKFRNDMAHGVFGHSMAIKDALVWVSTADYAAGSTANYKVKDYIRKKSKVILIGTMERMALEIETLDQSINSFGGYFKTDHINDSQFRAIRYPQLCSQPQIQRELIHLRQRQKNSL